jgi:hypothetical protein
MSDEQILQEYERFLEYYDGNVPSMEHEPIRFASYVKMFRYYTEREQNEKQRTSNI